MPGGSGTHFFARVDYWKSKSTAPSKLRVNRINCATGGFASECAGARRLGFWWEAQKRRLRLRTQKQEGPSELDPGKRDRDHLKMAATGERKNRTPESWGAVYGWSAGPKLLAGEARRGLGWELYARGFDGAAAARLRSLGSNRRVGATDGDGDVFAFTNEVKMILRGFPVDADHVTETNLFSGEKVGHRIDDVALDGALQMASAVALVGAFLQEKIAAIGGDAEKELPLGGFENTLLNHGEFDVENLLELLAMQGMENDDLVEAVHKFGRELAASGFDSRALNFFVKLVGWFVAGLDEAVAAAHEFGDFSAAEVGGKEDDCLGKIHAAIVAEGQRGLVQHAEEQLPEGVAGLFDFIEQQERELQFFGVRGSQGFLGNQGMRLAVAEITRRRADEFSNFVRVLELGAIDFNNQARISKKDFRGGFHNARLAGAGGTKKEQIADGAAGRVEAGAEDLIEVNERLHAFLLANDPGAKRLVEITGIVAADCRVQLLPGCCFHEVFLER